MKTIEACDHEAEDRWENTDLLQPQRPVRVCFLIDRLDTAGTETQLLALIRSLDRSRVEPYLVLLLGEDDVSRALEPADCPVLRLGVKSLLAPGALGGLWTFIRFLREKPIDVLQVYFLDSTYFGVLAGHLARVGYIVRTRNNINHWMTPTHRRLGRLLNRLVTVTVCNSQAARDAVLADERPDPASVIVIENGVDLERFAHIPPVSGEPAPDCPRRVGMVANLRPIKGVDILVRAAAQLARAHPDVEFHLAGEGPQRPELEQLIAELGLQDRFMLHGKVTDIPAFLATLDVAVLSSRAEGMPNSVLEYMAAGRPIVATAVGGAVTLIEDRVHGRLIPPDDPDRLAAALDETLMNPATAARMGQLARSRARAEFSRQGMARRYEALCEKFGRQERVVRPTGHVSAKHLFKAAFNLLAIVLSSPFWIPARLQASITGGGGLFNAGSESLSLVPGKTGIYLRRGFYRMCLNACASDAHLGFGTTLSHPQVRIGHGAYIGNRCTIGQVVIEDHVTIGSNVDILSGRRQHHFADPGRPIQDQGGVFQQITIGANTWIGNSAVVMADVGCGCVVGAGSVVVKPVLQGTVVGGNPARLIRSRASASSGHDSTHGSTDSMIGDGRQEGM